MAEKLAIIQGPQLSVEDHCGHNAIVFNVYVSEGCAACQWILPGDPRFIDLWDSLPRSGCLDFLNGKPCWVDEGDGMIIFKRLARIGQEVKP